MTVMPNPDVNAGETATEGDQVNPSRDLRTVQMGWRTPGQTLLSAARIEAEAAQASPAKAFAARMFAQGLSEQVV
ncbi:hypothetical protein ACG873_21560 [Mesorhizobium sp. AaZ16]|uniref:hypothetical protein n=1 Tax=Mesorhizobium sp. AaZ16 TaxID=3402289 RepID=UPI00374F1F93